MPPARSNRRTNVAKSAARATNAHEQASACVADVLAEAVQGESNKLPTFIGLDWSIKHLLRNKTDFSVLNGFLTSLLGEPIEIVCILESEGNKSGPEVKTNRVDILAQDSRGVKIIIEVQNAFEHDYFHRMLFGVSKVVTDYAMKGADYGKIGKIYSVNIVYFSLGQGSDYVYRGCTEFRGIHRKDILQLSKSQRDRFPCTEVSDIFPEYFVLRVDDFDKETKDALDQWIYFLKTNEILDNFNAPGMSAAREQLRFDRLTPEEKRSYLAHIDYLRGEKSRNQYVRLDGFLEGKAEGIKEGKAEGIKEGKAEGIKEGIKEGEAKATLTLARELKARGLVPLSQIAQITKLPLAEVEKL